MIAGIVTLYDSPNCGSKLQAFALSYAIKKMGYETCFLKTGARKPVVNKGKTACKFILQGKLAKACFYMKHIYAYLCSRFKFNDVSANKFANVDVTVFGSDEIWNVARNDISRYPVFWGHSINTAKISYAPSVHQSTEVDFLNNRCIEDLETFKSISVRDARSRRVISNLLKREVTVVCDPTMLLTKDDWVALETSCPEKEDFILLYCFAYQIKDDDVRKIRTFAEEKKMKLISVADYLPFADKNLPLNPESFIGYVHKANYVIASTFHGTCFSFIYNKEFAVISRNSPKVENMLSLFGSSFLNVAERESISEVLLENSASSIAKREEILSEIRESSYNWLRTNLSC